MWGTEEWPGSIKRDSEEVASFYGGESGLHQPVAGQDNGVKMRTVQVKCTARADSTESSATMRLERRSFGVLGGSTAD